MKDIYRDNTLPGPHSVVGEEIIVGYVERAPGVTNIYNQSRTKRYELRDSGLSNGHTSRQLSLLVRTSGGTWHELLGATQELDENGQVLASSISLDVLSRPNDPDSTANKRVFYDSRNDGRRSNGWGGGYYGKADAIRADLATFGALAIYDGDLPPEIDVGRTIDVFLDSYQGFTFSAPQFEIPQRGFWGTVAHSFRAWSQG